MKKICFTLFLFIPLFVQAQAFRLDTIQVSPEDNRNIHRGEPRIVQQNSQQHNEPTAANTHTQTQSTSQNNRYAEGDWRSELTPLPFEFDRSKLRLGANLGLSISRGYTLLAIGPQVGYQFNDYLMAGVGVKYHFNRINTPGYVANNNMLGINTFGYFYPMRFITIFAQPELNHIWRNVSLKQENRTERYGATVPVFLVGAGVRLANSHITLNYDLARHIYSPYPDRLFLGISAFF